MEIIDIARKFGINNVTEISELTGGHINKTFLVTASDGGKYVLQSLNTDVFREPEAVMSNISKLEAVFEKNAGEEIGIPHYLCTEEGADFFSDGGEFYRAYSYSEQTMSHSTDRYNAGYAFGSFIRILNSSKLKLRVTIENFHSFPVYFSALVSADGNSSLKKIDKSVMRRLSAVSDALEQVFTVDFPKRNVHNDAKCSNVIAGEKSIIIDLDTAMEGYAACDYGDLIRSVCTGRVLDTNAVMELTRGFADGLGGILTDDEIDSLYYGILYVTAELSVRYLIDYLSDNKYFKGKTSAECLGRANELLHQLNMFISGGDDITNIIYKAFGKQ